MFVCFYLCLLTDRLKTTVSPTISPSRRVEEEKRFRAAESAFYGGADSFDGTAANVPPVSGVGGR